VPGNWLSRPGWHLRVAVHRHRTAGNDSPKAIQRPAQCRRPTDHDDHAPGCLGEGRDWRHLDGGNPPGVLWRLAGMTAFRYEAIETSGAPVQGLIEAEDRKAALQLLGGRGLFPSTLEISSSNGGASAPTATGDGVGSQEQHFGKRIRRKDITAFTREMSALLSSAIPIPQALNGLGEQEENPALRDVVLKISDAVRKGTSFSGALDEHPKLFSKLYVNMVRVGEEAGALQKVMADLADLLEHEDEVRSEVVAAVAYPVFVLAFGFVTVTILLTVVLPKIMGMLQDMLPILPLPTLILLKVSSILHHYWLWILLGTAAAVGGLWRYVRSSHGAEVWDRTKLRLPILGSVFRAAALSRFARTLGTLVKSGVSLLPSLKIVENTRSEEHTS